MFYRIRYRYFFCIPDTTISGCAVIPTGRSIRATLRLIIRKSLVRPCTKCCLWKVRALFTTIVNWINWKVWQDPFFCSAILRLDNILAYIAAYLLLTHKSRRFDYIDLLLLFNPFTIVTMVRNVRDIYIILFVIIALIGLGRSRRATNRTRYGPASASFCYRLHEPSCCFPDSGFITSQRNTWVIEKEKDLSLPVGHSSCSCSFPFDSPYSRQSNDKGDRFRRRGYRAISSSTQRQYLASCDKKPSYPDCLSDWSLFCSLRTP